MKNVLLKLSKIQTELKAPKGQMNKFGNYKYRSCEDIMEAVKPLLKKHNCALPISDKVILIGDRYYIEATATLFDCESGESYSVTASAREEESKKGMDGSQVTGASSSYARKYALNGLLDIDDTKDSDATNTHGKDDPQPTEKDLKEMETVGAKKIELVHIAHIKSQLIVLGKDLDAYLTYKDIDKVENITLDQFTNDIKPDLEELVRKHKAKK
ncbi:MAG: ERF family protein [Porphyromonadaceae bacterium]|nr:ERF family protein [Porphyromonadaceae bacterium]